MTELWNAAWPEWMGDKVREQMIEAVRQVEGSGVYPEIIEEVLVSTTMDSVLRPEPEDIWLFGQNYIGTIYQPLRVEGIRVDMMPLSGRVDYLNISSKEFDWRTATEKSRLRVEFSTSDGNTDVFEVSGLDCNRLMEIIRQKFKANMIKFMGTACI